MEREIGNDLNLTNLAVAFLPSPQTRKEVPAPKKKKRKARVTVTPAMAGLILQMVKDGVKTGEIAAKVGVARSTVEGYKKKAKASAPAVSKTKTAYENVVKATKAGRSLLEIQKAFGLGFSTISAHRTVAYKKGDLKKQ